MSTICDAHKKKMDVELLYNSVHRKFNQLEFRSVGDKMRQRKPAPSRGGLQAPDWAVAVGEKMLGWGTCPREAWPPSPWLSSPGERERNVVIAIRVGVNMLQSCSVFNSLSHTTLSIKWEVDFSKNSSLLCPCYDSACICIMWLYNTSSSLLLQHYHPHHRQVTFWDVGWHYLD